MEVRKTLKRLFIGVVALVVLLIVAMFLIVCGPQPAPVSGTDRPGWLPATASDIFYNSQGGFGEWRAAEFTITESDFRIYAASQGWALEERENITPPAFGHLGLPRMMKNSEGEDELVVIPKVLVFEKRRPNGGGTSAVFDREKNRAFYDYSHR